MLNCEQRNLHGVVSLVRSLTLHRSLTGRTDCQSWCIGSLLAENSGAVSSPDVLKSPVRKHTYSFSLAYSLFSCCLFAWTSPKVLLLCAGSHRYCFSILSKYAPFPFCVTCFLFLSCFFVQLYILQQVFTSLNEQPSQAICKQNHKVLLFFLNNFWTHFGSFATRSTITFSRLLKLTHPIFAINWQESCNRLPFMPGTKSIPLRKSTDFSAVCTGENKRQRIRTDHSPVIRTTADYLTDWQSDCVEAVHWSPALSSHPLLQWPSNSRLSNLNAFTGLMSEIVKLILIQCDRLLI